MAASLVLAGHEVMTWEHPDFSHTIDPIQANLEIALKGVGTSGRARLRRALPT